MTTIHGEILDATLEEVLVAHGVDPTPDLLDDLEIVIDREVDDTVEPVVVGLEADEREARTDGEHDASIIVRRLHLTYAEKFAARRELLLGGEQS
jgi:hypothetical protein